MDKIVIFETYYNPVEAHIVKARLIDSGVQCFLSDENTITINPLYTQALGGVKLHLFERDVVTARNILQEKDDTQIDINQTGSVWHKNDETESAEICPNCGSGDVGYVQATKKRFGIFTIIISFLLMVYPFSVKKTHHCFNCQYEF